MAVPFPARADAQATSSNPPGPDPAIYTDRYIASDQPPDISTDETATVDTTGLARAVRVDLVGSLLSSHVGNTTARASQSGVALSTQWDTTSYGAWSLDASDQLPSSDLRGVPAAHALFRLVERGMPFDGGWHADAGLGDLNLPMIDLARFQSRFILPSAPLQGFSTEWRGPYGLQWVAGGGEPGVYSGLGVSDFVDAGGRIGSLGAQWSPSPQWSLGGELASAHDVRLYPGAWALEPDATSTTTGMLTGAWQGSLTRAQVTLVDGATTTMGSALGAWVDATTVSGHLSQSYGAFRIDPNLIWGDQLITNDVQGAYYQWDYQSRRGFAQVGVDQAWSVSGRAPESTFVSTNGRYQLSRDVGVGGAVNTRRSEDPLAWSVDGYIDVRNHWGIGRGEWEYGQNQAWREVTGTISQSWEGADTHLAALLGCEHVSDGSVPGVQTSSTAATIGINGDVSLSANLSINGNIRWDRTVYGARPSGLMANVGLHWQIARDWTALATYSESRLESWSTPVVTSPLAPPTETFMVASGQRALFLTVRFQRSAGLRFAPLGGLPGSGSGRLTGTIFLDANDNGQFDAGEGVARNITVILDGRFSTTTDNNGAFEFPAVAVGHHVITVSPDNLPLPWTVIGDGRVAVEVRTRDHTDVRIPVVRHSVLTRQGE
jgi:hypothetical protein